MISILISSNIRNTSNFTGEAVEVNFDMIFLFKKQTGTTSTHQVAPVASIAWHVVDAQ